MYKPSEEHVSQYELEITSPMSEEAIRKAFRDVQWMLQTDSYRTYYLDRLEALELALAEMLDKEKEGDD